MGGLLFSIAYFVYTLAMVHACLLFGLLEKALLERNDNLAEVASLHEVEERGTVVNSLHNVLLGRADLSGGDLGRNDFIEVSKVGLEDDEAVKTGSTFCVNECS